MPTPIPSSKGRPHPPTPVIRLDGAHFWLCQGLLSAPSSHGIILPSGTILSTQTPSLWFRGSRCTLGPSHPATRPSWPSILSSVAQSCQTLCNPMDCSTPGFPFHHQLLELAQTHVHRVSDAIQPSHPLLSPSPPAFNLSQLQGLFQ